MALKNIDYYQQNLFKTLLFFHLIKYKYIL